MNNGNLMFSKNLSHDKAASPKSSAVSAIPAIVFAKVSLMRLSFRTPVYLPSTKKS